jgi:hypothetical protein
VSPRWGALALACGAVALLALLRRLGLGLENPGTPLLVLVAYASVVAGTSGGLLATLPCLLYTAYHFGAGADGAWAYDRSDVQRLVVFAASAVLVTVIVGRATARRRRVADRAIDTERAHGRSRLAEIEQLSRVVLDSLPAHVAVIDADGRILSTNKAWQQFQQGNGGTATTAASAATTSRRAAVRRGRAPTWPSRWRRASNRCCGPSATVHGRVPVPRPAGEAVVPAVGHAAGVRRLDRRPRARW